MYKIREAKLEDYASFLPLYRESRKWRSGEENIPALEQEVYGKMVTNPSIKLYIVENNGEMHAFTLFYKQISTYYLQPAGKDVLLIEELYVKSTEARKGLDQHLFQKIERYARQTGMDRIDIALPIVAEEKIAYYKERLKLTPVDIVLRMDT